MPCLCDTRRRSDRIGGTRRMLRPVTASGAQSVSAYPQSPVGRSRPRQLPRPGWSPGRSRLSPADTGVTGQPVAPARRITGEIWILRLPAWGCGGPLRLCARSRRCRERLPTSDPSLSVRLYLFCFSFTTIQKGALKMVA